jgi:hypothetical protein
VESETVELKQVQLYFSGHDHGLQHVRLRDGSPTPAFFVSGGGGYRLHHSLKDEADGYANALAEPAFARGQFGFATVALNTSHAEVQFVLAKNGETAYEHTIAQQSGRGRPDSGGART